MHRIVVDAQVHPFAANTPERPWTHEMPKSVHLPSVTGAQMVAAMGRAGVDRAIAVSPVRVYGWDAGYAEEVYRDHPDRFRLVTPVNALDPNAVSRIKQWAATPGAVGIRMLFELMQMSPDDPDVAAAVHAAVDADLTINISCWGRLEIMEPMAKKLPEARFALDHLGMTQSAEPPAPEDPFAEIETVLVLATYPNVTIKVTGVGTVSHQPYPYQDPRHPVPHLRAEPQRVPRPLAQVRRRQGDVPRRDRTPGLQLGPMVISAQRAAGEARSTIARVRQHGATPTRDTRAPASYDKRVGPARAGP